MYNNKRSVMGKWKRILIAVALTASVILALPVWDVGSAEAAPDLGDGKCKLTIQRAGNNAEQGEVIVDLYKVASVDEEFTGYDAYKLKLEDAYDTEDVNGAFDKAQNPGEDESANELYRNMAQEVAKIALGQIEGSTAQATSLHAPFAEVNNVKSAVFDNLDPGMYLVIAHGTDLTDIDKYVTEVSDETGKKQLATIAYNNQYVYTYLPELISLPMRAGADGSFNTADRTEWVNDVTVFLKSEEELRHASLEIIKNLNMAPLSGDSCVFRVVAALNGETVYDSYVSVDFAKGETKKSVTLNGVIPVGASITITEEYSGASYEIDQNANIEQTIDHLAEADTIDDESGKVTKINNTVTFTNNRTNSGVGGGAITNNFKYGDGGWEWSKDPGLSSGNTSAEPIPKRRTKK